MKLNELRKDFVVVDQPVRGLRSGKLKYRFIVLKSGKLYASDYRFKTVESAEKAGEKLLAGKGR